MNTGSEMVAVDDYTVEVSVNGDVVEVTINNAPFDSVDMVDGTVDTKAKNAMVARASREILEKSREEHVPYLCRVIDPLAANNPNRRYRISPENGVEPIADHADSDPYAPSRNSGSSPVSRRSAPRPMVEEEDEPTGTIDSPVTVQQAPALTPAPAHIRRKDVVPEKKPSPLQAFTALALWKRIAICITAAVLVLFGFAALGGSKDYTGVCVDTRTQQRILDTAPCDQQQVAFYRWYYVEKGSEVPDIGSAYTEGAGTFDKPTQGTITFT